MTRYSVNKGLICVGYGQKNAIFQSKKR
jgi:hypothetical protein